MGTGTAWLLARLLPQRVNRCWHGCQHSECMAVGKVASTATASLWAYLQSCRRHRCVHYFFFCEGSNTNGWGVFPAGGHLRTGCKVNQVPSPRCDHAWHRRTRCPAHSNICKSSVFVHTLDDSERVRINWKRYPNKKNRSPLLQTADNFIVYPSTNSTSSRLICMPSMRAPAATATSAPSARLSSGHIAASLPVKPTLSSNDSSEEIRAQSTLDIVDFSKVMLLSISFATPLGSKWLLSTTKVSVRAWSLAICCGRCKAKWCFGNKSNDPYTERCFSKCSTMAFRRRGTFIVPPLVSWRMSKTLKESTNDATCSCRSGKRPT